MLRRFSVPHVSPLLRGTFVARYDRFIAQVRLDSGKLIAAHCVNPGRMEGQLVDGARAYVLDVNKPSRKLRYTLELLETEGADGEAVLTGANTTAPHRVIAQALREKAIPGLRRFTRVDEEVTVTAEGNSGNSKKHRFDFVLRGKRDHFVELKNCHLVYSDRRAYFPDSQTKRGASHVLRLQQLALQGARASVLFAVQRADILRSLRPSDLHDPAFAAACRAAAAAGVRFSAVQVRASEAGYTLERTLPVDLKPYDTAPLRSLRDDNASTSGWKRGWRAEAKKMGL